MVGNGEWFGWTRKDEKQDDGNGSPMGKKRVSVDDDMVERVVDSFTEVNEAFGKS